MDRVIIGILIAIAATFAAVGSWVRRKFGRAALGALTVVTAAALVVVLPRIEPFRSEFKDVYGLVRFSNVIATVAAALVLNWRAHPSDEDPDLLLDTIAGAAAYLVGGFLAFWLPLMGMPGMS